MLKLEISQKWSKFYGWAIRSKRSVDSQSLKANSSDSDQALQASDSISHRCSLVPPDSESKTSRSGHFKIDVSVSSSSQESHQSTLAVGGSNINIENSLGEKINSLLQQEILYKETLEEMEGTRKNEIV